MKTKDFVKMLLDADPTGEHHVRLNGGFPGGVELKEGYYDGSYNYIDDDGNFVRSNEGAKVDIYTMDIDDFVERHYDEKDPENWDKIKKKIIFKLDDYADVNQRKEAENEFLILAKKAWNEWNEAVIWSKNR